MALLGFLLIDGGLLVGIPAVFCGLVWMVCGLWKGRLHAWGAILVFIPGALTACVWYGHRGPVWLLLLLWSNADGKAYVWGLWMLGSGLFMVFVFGLLRDRLSVAPPRE